PARFRASPNAFRQTLSTLDYRSRRPIHRRGITTSSEPLLLVLGRIIRSQFEHCLIGVISAILLRPFGLCLRNRLQQGSSSRRIYSTPRLVQEDGIAGFPSH